ncbi:hypothetical protein ACVW0I_005299 [Bradyrhizobium sp. LM6.11]
MPDQPISGIPPVSARVLLSHRAFLFFLLSRSLSRFSSQIAAVAIGWQIYDLTGSAFDLGMVGLVQFLPTALLVFVAGHAADRYERKRVVQLCQLVEAATALYLGVITYLGLVSEVQIFVATFVLGIAGAFESPTTAALLPAIAPQGSLQRATAVSSGAAQVATITGPALGGFAYAVAPHLAYAMMVLFWIFGMILTGFIRPRPQAIAKEGTNSDNVFAGVRFIRSNPAILGTISLDLFAVLFGGVTALLPIYARDILPDRSDGAGDPTRRARGRRAGDDHGAGPSRHFAACGPAHVSGRDRVRRRDDRVRTVVLDVAVGARARHSRRGRYDQCRDPLLAGAARDPRRDARPGRCGELPLHQRVQPARPVRERGRRRTVRRHAGGRSRWRLHGRSGAAMDEAVSKPAAGGEFGVGRELSPLVIARSPCDEAIQIVAPEGYWIASLRSQ